MRRTGSQASPKSVHAKSFGEEIVVIIEASISTIETMEDRPVRSRALQGR
jgi:hypothetical protein